MGVFHSSQLLSTSLIKLFVRTQGKSHRHGNLNGIRTESTKTKHTVEFKARLVHTKITHHRRACTAWELRWNLDTERCLSDFVHIPQTAASQNDKDSAAAAQMMQAVDRAGRQELELSVARQPAVPSHCHQKVLHLLHDPGKIKVNYN